MAKAIRLGRKAAVLGGKLVLDTNGAPCCCGGGGCPECADPTFPAGDACEQSPCAFYNGSQYPAHAVHATVRRYGSVRISANWNGLDHVTANVVREWDRSDEVQMAFGNRNNPCAITANIPAIEIPFPFVGDGQAQVGQILLDFGLGSPIAPWAVLPFLGCIEGDPPTTDQSFQVTTLLQTVGSQFPSFRVVARGGMKHGSGDLLRQYGWANPFLYSQSLGRFVDCSEFTIRAAGVSVAGKMSGACVCGVGTCTVFRMRHENTDGHFEVAGTIRQEQTASCLYTVGNQPVGGTRTNDDGGCARVPGNPQRPAPPLDPAVAAILDLQARGGGCRGCNE